MAPPAHSGGGAGGGGGGGGGNNGSGVGGKSSATVPGRIGRPPQWTSTRSRKLARLYMYTTLSVDKILKVLEDDVFKPRKNSAQKTIHNMLDHDPRYLRPESREDMNQRIRLLSASTQRSRRTGNRQEGEAVSKLQSQPQLQPQSQSQLQPHHQLPYQQPAQAHHQSHQPQQQHHQHHQYPFQQHPLQHQLQPMHSFDSIVLPDIKQETPGHPMQLSHLHASPMQPSMQPLSQHSYHLPMAQHQHQHQHQHQQHPQHQQHQHHHQPHTNHAQHSQHSQQHPQHPHDQAYVQQQYYQSYAAQHHALSMQQLAQEPTPPQTYVGSSWPGFYGHAMDDGLSNAPFDMNQSLMVQQQQQHQQQHHHHHHSQPHQHPHQHQHQHHLNLPPPPTDGGISSSQLPLFPTEDRVRARRGSSAAYSTASSDVSTETIQDLKKRLSGCSTHYANQVANLLRRFTISSGSDEPVASSPSPATPGGMDSDRGRVRKHRRPAPGSRHPHYRLRRSRSADSVASMTNESGSESDGGRPGGADKAESDNDDKTNNGGNWSDSDSFSGSSSEESAGHYREEDGKMIKVEPRPGGSGGGTGSGRRRHRRGGRRHSRPILSGAGGDNTGHPRLALPGDFFNAYLYRQQACPHEPPRENTKRDGAGVGSEGGGRVRRIGEGRGSGKKPNSRRERGCWCAVADAVATVAAADGSFWVLGDGRLAPEAQAILHEPSASTLARRDCFGHTLLHLFAARPGMQMQLLAMVLNCDDASLVAANTAGQTFLHLLSPDWFESLHEPYAPLLQLLQHLRQRAAAAPAAAVESSGSASGSGSGSVSGPGPGGDTATDDAHANPVVHFIYATDVYGRSFFHRLHAFVDDPAILAGIAQNYNRASMARRDACNNTLFSEDTLGGGSTLDENSPAPGGSYGGGGVPMVFTNEDAFIRHHESLLRIVTASDSHPGVEDTEGRNGLHCLAEAIVDKRMMDEHRNALSMGRRPPKKKTMDKREVRGGSAPGIANSIIVGGGSNNSTPATTSSSTTPLSGSSSATATTMATSNLGYGGGGGGGGSINVNVGVSSGYGPAGSGSMMTAFHPPSHLSTASLLHTSADGPQMATRLRLVQGLLSSPGVVDVNHYDRRGQTVLTSFVVHIADDQEDKGKSLAAILETLLAAGARLEGRNRRGETALLVAARLGRKIALTTLLEHGANVHVRDAAGHGVLDVIDLQCRRHARNDVALYGRLEACRVLLTGIKQLPLGVKQRPTVLDEWSMVCRGPEPRDMMM